MAGEPIKILTDKEVIAAIPQLIKEADEFFTLVSPSTSFEGSWLADITTATQRGIEVCVVYNPYNFEEAPKNQHLSRLPEKVERYEVEFLHAKIYLTDKSVIVTSMNYTSSSNRNREIAVRFDRKLTQQAYDEIREYVDELLGRIPDRNKSESVQRLEKTRGHCIYCGTNVSYNPQKPLCYSHWKPGLSDKPTTKHNYCHRCGGKRETTFTEPLCDECRNG